MQTARNKLWGVCLLNQWHALLPVYLDSRLFMDTPAFLATKKASSKQSFLVRKVTKRDAKKFKRRQKMRIPEDYTGATVRKFDDPRNRQ